MHANTISVGSENSAVIAVDPLVDFGKGGVFERCYGEEDSAPVLDAVDALRKTIDKLQRKAKLILCRSKYTYDQFGVRGLEELCTTEEGRTSLLPREWFAEDFEKTDNSIFASETDMEARLESLEHLVLCGVTTTSCVLRSLLDIREKLKHLTLIVPRKHVASRKNRAQEEHALLEEWSSMKEQKIIVVPSLEAIDFY